MTERDDLVARLMENVAAASPVRAREHAELVADVVLRSRESAGDRVKAARLTERLARSIDERGTDS